MGRLLQGDFSKHLSMERLGLLEKDAGGHFYVPGDEIDANFRLAA